jgi:HEAT repeat protein
MSGPTRTGWVCLGFLALASATALAIGTIKELSLADGRDDVNKVTAPLVDGSAAVTVGAIASGFDRGAKIVRKGATNFMTRGPEYNLDKGLDLGSLFATALREEAAAMGFKPSGAEAWDVGGTIKDVYMESKQIPYGATLFYGYLDVEFALKKGGGAAETVRMRLHNYNGGYNAGMGRKDEAGAALAHLLVEGAQEALARLNRTHFKAPPAAGVKTLLDQVKVPGPQRKDAAVYQLGLSGSPDAPALLLQLIPQETDENRRSMLIEALGRLQAAEAVPLLAQRLGTEEEDCRWFTLKAMDYIGGDVAAGVVKGAGVKDKDGGPRRLAERIASASGK